MTTTCMKDSAVGDDWIREACRMNPVQALGNDVFRSGPVRLTYHALKEARAYKQGTPQAGKPKFRVEVLLPPHADVVQLERAAIEVGARAFPAKFSGGQLYGVPLPFEDQGKKGIN